MVNLLHVRFDGIEPQARRPARTDTAAMRPCPPSTRRGSESPGTCAAQPAEPLAPFLAWLLQQAELNPAAYRTAPLQRRLPACLRALHVASPEAARKLIEQQPDLLPSALEACLIGVSEFFRDRAVFECLRGVALPQLLQSRRGLRVLSAGCARGQELYSVAMLLDECGALDGSVLVGLDINPRAITAAKEGRFAASELGSIDAPLRAACWVPEGPQYRVAPRLRARMQWRVADLLTASGTGEWDLVLFRNVAIYLAPGDAVRLWEDLAAQLTPGGFLVSGKAERATAPGSLRRISHCIYRKAGVEESRP